MLISAKSITKMIQQIAPVLLGVLAAGNGSLAAQQTDYSIPQETDRAVSATLTDDKAHPQIIQPAPQDLAQPQDAAAAVDASKAQAALAKKVASAHKPLFYDNDFSYLSDPNYCDWQFGDSLKRIPMFGCGYLEIGGQYRQRYHVETNHRGLGLTGGDDSFLLHRTRVYGNLRLNSDVRIFAELLDADSNFENLPSRPIEVNRTEMQNLFIDMRLFVGALGEWSTRVGRQELLFGSQRAVSPLDWANTRRTFEGARVTLKNEQLTVDGFWVNPMRIDNNSFDSPDRDQEYMGVYASRKVASGQTLDAYFLRHLNGRGTNNFKYDTVGMRASGSRNQLLYDIEAAFQFGDNTDGSDHAAGMATFGLGKKIACHCWNPTLWLYYDWASGDNDRGAGNGFHHGFPLAHKYLGFMDLYGRRNIEDLNMLFTLQPSQRLKLLTWYHYFFLETQSDTPYSVVMTPFNGANAPGSTELGHEIDMVASYKISARQNVVLGYSHFIAGDYYSTTAGVPYNGDANFWYSQWTINY